MFGREIILNKVAGGGGGENPIGCTDILNNYDPFGDSSGLSLYHLDGNGDDENPSSDDVTPVNVSFTTGLFSQAAQLNGTNAYLNSPRTLSLGKTITLWFNPEGFSQDEVYYFYGATAGQYNWTYIGIRYSNSTGLWTAQLRIRQAVGKYLYQDAVLTNLNPNGWNFFTACLKNSSGYECSLNGQVYNPTTSASASTITGMTTSAPALGRATPNGTTAYGRGLIEQVRIFDRSLTPYEIESLYGEQICACEDNTSNTLDILGDSSCVAAYQFDGNTNDLSGNHTAINTANMTYVAGKFDLAIRNTSSSQFVDVPSISLSPNTAFSVSLWSKTTDRDQRHYLFNYSSGAGATSAWGGILESQPGKLYLNFCNNTAVSTALVPENEWFHFAVSYDGSNAKAYLNGAEVIDANLSTNNIGSNRLTFLDVITSWTNPDASLDQVRIFNKALSTGEVTTLYNEEPCGCGGSTYTLDIFGDGNCIAAYNFNDSIYDLSGNYNPSSVGNNVTFTPGYLNKAATFSTSTGTDNRVTFPSNLFNKRTVFSVSYWTKTNSTYSTSNSFYVLGSTVGNAYDMNFSPEGLKGHGGVTSGARLIIPDFWTTYHTIGTWNHTVVVRDGSYMAVYYNGVKRVERTDASSYYSATNAFTKMGTGNDYNVAQKGFDGQIDQLRIFDRLITEEEVNILFNETTCGD